MTRGPTRTGRGRRTGRLAGLAALLAVLALVACACAATLETRIGLVIAVEGTGPAAIGGFTLRTADGQVMEFSTLTTVFDRSGFPPEHLREHLTLASPVRVTYHTTDGRNDVVKLEDAPTP